MQKLVDRFSKNLANWLEVVVAAMFVSLQKQNLKSYPSCITM